MTLATDLMTSRAAEISIICGWKAKIILKLTLTLLTTPKYKFSFTVIRTRNSLYHFFIQTFINRLANFAFQDRAYLPVVQGSCSTVIRN